VATPLASLDRVQAERLLRKQRVRQAVGEGTTAVMPLWAWRVGSVLLIGQPNEAYSWLQTELRRRFPDQTIAVMNVVNGHFGYLPPQELYREDIYQVWQTPFAPGCLERVLAAAEEAVQNLVAEES
jgi:hypothetical protein